MKTQPHQLGLFDTDQQSDQAASALARARMREMIDRLSTTDVPPWKDQMGVILDDGAFKRAMYLVPAEEAEKLWTEYDAHMERLYAIWAKAAQGQTHVTPSPPAPHPDPE